MTYHIIIQQERRVSTPEQPRELALSISTTKLVGEESAIDRTQLHTHTGANLQRVVGEEVLPPDFSDPQFVGVFEWDGQSPYIIQHKGDYSARTMGYAGWPSITKEQYDALAVPQAA